MQGPFPLHSDKKAGLHSKAPAAMVEQRCKPGACAPNHHGADAQTGTKYQPRLRGQRAVSRHRAPIGGPMSPHTSRLHPYKATVKEIQALAGGKRQNLNPHLRLPARRSRP